MAKVIVFLNDPSDAWLPFRDQMKAVLEAGIEVDKMEEIKIYIGIEEDSNEAMFLTFLSDDVEVIKGADKMWRYHFKKVGEETDILEDENIDSQAIVSVIEGMLETNNISKKEKKVESLVKVGSDTISNLVDEGEEASYIEVKAHQKIYSFEMKKVEVDNIVDAYQKENQLKKLFSN